MFKKTINSNELWPYRQIWLRPRQVRSWRRASLLCAVVLATVAWVATSSTPRLLWVVYPVEEQRVGTGGVQVLVRFAPNRRVDFDSFRVFLNRADVTDRFVRGRNGAYGLLVALLEGPNLLRFEVSGDRGGLPARELLDSREVRVWMRPPEHMDRAGLGVDTEVRGTRLAAARPRSSPAFFAGARSVQRAGKTHFHGAALRGGHPLDPAGTRG